MVTILSQAARAKLVQLASEIAMHDSVDNLTFDSVVEGFGLGANLHSLYTNPTTSKDELKALKTLEGYGITYEVMLHNTHRVRSENPQVKYDLTIEPEAPIGKDAIPLVQRSTWSTTAGPTNQRKSPPANGSDMEPDDPSKKAPPANSKPVEKIYINIYDARARYLHWINKSGPGAIAYALQTCMQQSKTPNGQPLEDVMIGDIRIKRSEFIGVMQILQNQGEIVGPKLEPAGKLLAGVKDISQQRADTDLRNQSRL